MPFTLSHAAAAIPMKKVAPSYLNFSALVVGSFLPDFIYYFPIPGISRDFTHTPLSTIVYALPVGWIILILFLWMREELIWLLPTEHRELLLRFSAPRFDIVRAEKLPITLSLFVGTWSHLIWDSFTHEDGWVVTRVSFLNHGFGASDQAIWSVLQHLSSALGFAVICAAYILWARARGVSTFDYKKINLSKRFLFWSALVVLSVLGALALWNNPVSLVEDHPSATEKAIVSATIRSVRFFTAGLFSTALVLKVRKKLAELQAARAL